MCVCVCVPPSLQEYVNKFKVRGTAMPEREVVRVSAAMVRAVRLVHGAGVIHGDIKPNNWLLDDATLCPTLIDYGCAVVTGGLPSHGFLTGPSGVKEFECPAMLSGEPWSFDVRACPRVPAWLRVWFLCVCVPLSSGACVYLCVFPCACVPACVAGCACVECLC